MTDREVNVLIWKFDGDPNEIPEFPSVVRDVYDDNDPSFLMIFASELRVERVEDVCRVLPFDKCHIFHSWCGGI